MQPIVQTTQAVQPDAAAPVIAPAAAGADSLASALANHLALTRAVYEIEQSFHWRTRGVNFLANHDLFSRVYSLTYSEIDGIAEKILGITGEQDAVDPVAQSEVTAQMVKGMNPAMDPIEFAASALMAELNLMASVDALLSRPDLTQGLQNFLQGVADKHEVSVYLLKQTVSA